MKPLKILNFEIKKVHLIGLIVCMAIIILSFIFLRETKVFYFILGMSFLIAGLPFFVSLISESNLSREKDEMFLEFSRNLVESVKAGTPISKSIVNVKSKDYGGLSPYINKLANQITLGIPVKTAFETFARDVGNRTVIRAVSIISESEKAGGEIGEILESVVKSVSQIEKLRKERMASTYSLVVQGYIIFIIFIVIMLVMQFNILPIASGLGTGTEGINTTPVGSFSGFGMGARANSEELARPFIWLLIIQGFFAGLVIGKLSEGKLRAGLKHSFILLVLALLINTGANAFLK
ncbi:type II secretion system F family protein [Candidatus Pacearchaeota archaeon]|nr:type II secretion system F family protein [Candidatus Pacearchaeota archaeon]